MNLPPSITSSFQGAAQAFEDSLSSEVYLLVAALVAVYIVLGVLYESYIHPVTILSTLPSAGIGALLALMIAGSDLDVIGIIGIVLLIGIVKKNAIMIVDFALEAEREHGKPAREAIFEASLLRFRPILMTTLAAMLGALPMLLGSGTGSELRRPLGLAIIGGLILEPGADALHHAGHLPVLRPAGAARECAASRTPSARRRRRTRREHLGVVHPAPGRDHAAGGRDRCCPGCWRISACRSRRCRTSPTRSSWCRPTWRARARTSWPRPSPSRWSGASRPSPT